MGAFSEPDLKVGVVEVDLAELVGNLLDNACKWAGSRVKVSIEQRDRTAILIVADDGPGIPDADLSEALVRGRQLDEQKRGSGFGLAIAHDIVTAYRGRIDLRRSHLGGLRAEALLPLAL